MLGRGRSKGTRTWHFNWQIRVRFRADRKHRPSSKTHKADYSSSFEANYSPDSNQSSQPLLGKSLLFWRVQADL